MCVRCSIRERETNSLSAQKVSSPLPNTTQAEAQALQVAAQMARQYSWQDVVFFYYFICDACEVDAFADIGRTNSFEITKSA